MDQFESILRTLFAQIPANLFIQEEKFYHSLFIMIAYLCGVEVEAEVNTNIGRIDGVIEFSDRIYIIEFKI
ncbi:MAG: PD-(D/E)XK nuclease domain-containing protein [Ignavibacteriales bacterium]|nr:PD-(D/E)XK nuclease domain-containing protein [Ignavibacteriales bacterium]